MDRIHEHDQPRYLQHRQADEDWPLGEPNEAAVGPYLLGALVLCLDVWLLGVLAVRWLT